MTDTFASHIETRHDVDTASALLKRLYLAERDLMRSLGAWHISLEHWEAKLVVPRHWWLASRHADALRTRVLELRYPRRDVDKDHDPRLARFLGELVRAQSDAEFLTGIYGVMLPALANAYQDFIDEADPITDAPSIALITHALIDLDEVLTAGDALLASLDEPGQAAAWRDYLTLSLDAIGGLLGIAATADHPEQHPCASRPDYVVPQVAVRPKSFAPARVESPGRPPRNRREQQVWYAIDHANEVWAAEVPGAFMWQFPNMPWAFYTDVARWGYDEMRHAQLGMRRLAAWGFEIGQDYPMVGDPIHAIHEMGGGPLELLALLYYFEKDAPAHRMVTKKEFDAMDDADTAIDTDFDWADEAIHLKYGFTWLQHLVGADKPDEMKALVQRAGQMWDTWLAERWDRGEDLYGPFMERIEARIAAAEAGAS